MAETFDQNIQTTLAASIHSSAAARVAFTVVFSAFVFWVQAHINAALLQLYLDHTVDAPLLYDVFDNLWTTKNKYVHKAAWNTPYIAIVCAIVSRFTLIKTGLSRTETRKAPFWKLAALKFWAWISDYDMNVNFWRVGVMNLLKAICGVVTLLPDRGGPSREFCSNADLRETFSSCGDMIFSGHAAHIYLCLNMLVHDQRMSQLVAIIIGALCSLLILVTRIHYTVDVIVALFVCAFIERHLLYEKDKHTWRNRALSSSLSDSDSSNDEDEPDKSGHSGSDNTRKPNLSKV